MRVTLKSEGGIAHFPGLAKPLVLDSDALPPEAAAALRELVETSGVFQLPSVVGTPASGAADMRTHTLTVEDGDRRHRVSVAETAMPASFRALIQFVRAHGTRV